MAYYSDLGWSTDSGDETGQEGALPGDALPGYNMPPDSAPSSDDDTPGPDEPRKPTAMAARAYQLEMLDASLQQNIIVAMDTGSGKTQVAVLRIMAELETARQSKRVWFLAPTVALGAQQFDVIRSQIPSAIWDAVLGNVRIVVSTYQILLEALQHGFVKLGSLALIVFDEAHNCAKKHPGRRIMTEFYHPAKEVGQPVPKILGLTASPVMRSKLSGLEELERTLDAVCKPPTMHREELLKHVNRPSMISVPYRPTSGEMERSGGVSNVSRLQRAFRDLDIDEDPWVRHLRAQYHDAKSETTRQKLLAAVASRNTNTQNALKTFCRKALAMSDELGPWAAEYYVYEIVRRAIEADETREGWGDKVADDEKRYLADLFRSLGGSAPLPPAPNLSGLSGKARGLLKILAEHEGAPVGIVFVTERAAVSVLSHLLSAHPLLGGRYRVASMVGSSTWRGRPDPLDLVQAEDLLSIHRFRSGRVNLLVATSVLEEGIDVPVCNLVVCVDRPPNLKSFIQRRGRARMHTSRLYLLFDESAADSLREWQDLEEAMKEKYSRDREALEAIEAVEASETPKYPPLRVPSTGARLGLDDAKGHLEHFCTTLSSRKYVDLKPSYVFREDPDTGLIGATVVLPASLPLHLRRVDSAASWKAERNACKDAAFQAYKALYETGLVNDNLLPIKEADLSRDVEGRPGTTTAKAQYDPWREVARAWAAEGEVFRRPVRLSAEDGSPMCILELMLPTPVADMGTLSVQWGPASAPWTVDFGADTPAGVNRPVPGAGAALEHTSTLLAMAYGHRWPIPDNHQFVRFASAAEDLRAQRLGCHSFAPDLFHGRARAYLARDPSSCPYIFQSYLPTKPPLESVRDPYRGFEDAPEDAPYLVVKSWPKTTGFLRRQGLAPAPPSTKPYPRVLPADETRFDDIPLVYAQFGSLIPTLTHVVEAYLVARELLSSTRLGLVGISDLSLVVTAISASSAARQSNYERIEFLGDSVLKLCATVTCAAKNLHFPEGYLSLLKDRLVANSRLSRAAVEFTLDRFIITRNVNVREWRKRYETDLLAAEDAEPARRLSTKVLADVVEALIGAAFVDGGIQKALRCISVFLTEMDWRPLAAGRAVLFDAAPAAVRLPSTLEPLEALLGYTFTKKSLLVEAVTHSSYNAPGPVAPLERLEFLGDAVLDYLVVTRLFAADPPLAHFDMHLLRTALVNGDFLAFLALEWSAHVPVFEAVLPAGGRPVALVESEARTPLWRFLRYSSPELGVEGRAAEDRHAAGRGEVAEALRGGESYPWAALARLRAPKFLSDAVEALLGAVWVDSGSFEACAALAGRLGVLPFLERALRDGVRVLHPKEELGRLADREPVRYAVAEAPLEGGDREFVCSVFVGERMVARVGGGVSREEAKTRAATEAVEVLREEREGGTADGAGMDGG